MQRAPRSACATPLRGTSIIGGPVRRYLSAERHPLFPCECFNGFMSEKLFEHESEESMTREETAARLRELADALERQNKVRVQSGETDVIVDVPDHVGYEYEIEVKQGGKSEIEVKIFWK